MLVHHNTFAEKVVPLWTNVNYADGDSAFPVATPTLWNSTPSSIAMAPSTNAFKRQLKAHFFLEEFQTKTQLFIFIKQILKYICIGNICISTVIYIY